MSDLLSLYDIKLQKPIRIDIYFFHVADYFKTRHIWPLIRKSRITIFPIFLPS